MISHEFWLERWQSGRIGFHQDDINPWLVEYWPILPKNSRVLVPLCGKSNDLIWLAEQGYQVTGVELSSLAVVQFFGDNDLAYQTHLEGDFKVHTAQTLPLRIVEGDYFRFCEEGFDACYDRAAMIAIPDRLRKEYVSHTLDRLSPAAFVLLISVRYDGGNQGPPFSVEEEDIVSMWGNDIQKIASEDLAQIQASYRERGFHYFEESAWHITVT